MMTLTFCAPKALVVCRPSRLSTVAVKVGETGAGLEVAEAVARVDKEGAAIDGADGEGVGA